MEEQSFSDLFRHYLTLLIRWAWLLILATIIAGGTTFLVSKYMTPIYQASTTVLIDQAPDSNTSEYTAILTSERLTRTYTEMISYRVVLEEVITNLELDMKFDELLEIITIQPVRDTQLIKLQVEHSNPSQAAIIANSIVEVFSGYNLSLQEKRYSESKQSLMGQLEQINEHIQLNQNSLNALEDIPENMKERDRLEAILTNYRQSYTTLLQSYEELRIIEARSSSGIIQVQKAVPPEKPIRPRTLINTLLAAIIGLMFSTVVVFMIDALDDTIKDPDQITKQFGIPILGLIATFEQSNDGPITLTNPMSPIAESFRLLRENIRYVSIDEPIKVLAISSANSGVGKSTVAANLAIVFAQGEKKVILMDADLRRPKIQKLFNIPNRKGLTELLVQPEINFEGTVQNINIERLSIITSGGIPPNPSDLLSSQKMVSIMNQLRKQADMIIIDTTPVFVVADAMALSSNIDGVILVVKPGSTTTSSFERLIEQYNRIGLKILGVVVNGFRPGRLGSYYYKDYYYSDHHYFSDGKSKKKQKEL